MYISLIETPEEIKFGDIIKYDDEACVVINSNGFGNEDFPVLVVNLARSKVMNSFSNLGALNDSECELMAEENKVELKFIEKVEGY